MTKQIWFCLKCHTCGEVEYGEDEDAFNKIKKDHVNRSQNACPAIGPRVIAVPLTDPVAMALLFHNTYEKLAPKFDYVTRPESRIFDPESQNGKLMVEVSNEILAVLREKK